MAEALHEGHAAVVGTQLGNAEPSRAHDHLLGFAHHTIGASQGKATPGTSPEPLAPYVRMHLDFRRGQPVGKHIDYGARLIGPGK